MPKMVKLVQHGGVAEHGEEYLSNTFLARAQIYEMIRSCPEAF